MWLEFTRPRLPVIASGALNDQKWYLHPVPDGVYCGSKDQIFQSAMAVRSHHYEISF